MESKAAIIQVLPGKFHVFPSVSTSQDVNMSGIGASKGITIRNLIQKDGTRFKYIQAPEHTAITDLIHRIYDTKPGHEEIVPELPLSEDFIPLLAAEDSEFRVYKTNLFTNGYRLVPIVIDHKRLCCYNVQKFFPKLIPEDNFGIFIRNESDLQSVFDGPFGEPRELDYLSNKRMCPMCRVVSDHSKPPKKPWYTRKVKS